MTVHVSSNGNKITGAYSEAETKKATIKLLRTIVVLTQTLKPLPDDVMMTMKLLYYDHGMYSLPIIIIVCKVCCHKTVDWEIFVIKFSSTIFPNKIFCAR